MQMMRLKAAALVFGAGLMIALTGLGIAKTTALPGAVGAANTKGIKPIFLLKGRKQTHMNTAATVVQKYLDSCAAKKWQEAYQLLSPTTQQLAPLNLFQQVKQFPADPTADGMTPTLTAVSAFFIDQPNPSGYRYTIVGVSPANPNIVLVQAKPPATISTGLLHLKIVTITANSAQVLLMDLMKSMQESDPAGAKKAAQWAEDRAKK